MKLFDSHVHLTSKDVMPHLETILLRARRAGVSHIVNVCTNIEELERGIELNLRYPWIVNAGATTPHDVDLEGEKNFDTFVQAAKKNQLVALGETGLDYHYEYSKKSTHQKFLIRYLHLAKECQLPVIFHCREAFPDLFAIADQEYSKTGPAIVHCFTGSIDEAKGAIDRGWLISFSGIITFKKSQALRDVARSIPLDRILIETDAPYLSPQSQRGKPNEPANIQETASCLAAVKNLSLEEVARITTRNAEKYLLGKIT